MSRVQFLPVILSPIFVGSVLAWWADRVFSPSIFALVMLGSISIHLAANSIDDAYDFESGVDVVSNSMFPPNFGGWKPLPRGMMTIGQAKFVAYSFFLVSVVIGFYLTFLAGPTVLLLGSIGVFFAYFHVAPPLKLGYRGLGLSELGIFLSFGVLPVMGSFFVQANHISPLSALIGTPLGFLTTSILINHDQIFFEVYEKSGKRSFAVGVGRKRAIATTFTLTLLAYAIIIAGTAARILPLAALLVLLSLPFFVIQVRLYQKPPDSPLHYVKLTQTTFALSVIFGLLLTIAMIIG